MVKRKMRPIGALVIGSMVVLLIAAALTQTVFLRGLFIGIVIGPLIIAGSAAVIGMHFRRKFAGKQAAELQPPPLPTSSWDYDLELKTLAGEAVDASSWKGSVLVINYWATWCTPCAAEMPAMQRLVARTADAGVRFAFISTETADVVSAFVGKKKWDLPFYLQDGEGPDVFKRRGIPATFVLDRNGTIVMRHFGAAAWDADSVVSFIRGLAAL